MSFNKPFFVLFCFTESWNTSFRGLPRTPDKRWDKETVVYREGVVWFTFEMECLLNIVTVYLVNNGLLSFCDCVCMCVSLTGPLLFAQCALWKGRVVPAVQSRGRGLRRWRRVVCQHGTIAFEYAYEICTIQLYLILWPDVFHPHRSTSLWAPATRQRSFSCRWLKTSWDPACSWPCEGTRPWWRCVWLTVALPTSI